MTDNDSKVSKNFPSRIKIIKDCIYGHIHISALCIKFMDVPEFQRLRRVKQLGMAHYVYPSASHTRFEHSLGVMHMAGRMIDQLRNFVEISDRTKDLVQLAGMYHDIGHFAYSHLFDKFLKCHDVGDDLDPIFKLKDHEERSVFFLRQVNNRLQLLTEEEELLVENIISGHIPSRDPGLPMWASLTSNIFHPFLYEIVCNSECGLDVDKLDYVNRDSMHTGLPGFQADYILLNALIDKDGHLAFREKARRDIHDMYESRHRMYENVYQHHTSLKMDKLYYCMLQRLGPKTFQYGQQTDDFNMETLIRYSEETKELMVQVEARQLIHDCEHCREFSCIRKYCPSGSIEEVRFI